MSRNSRGCILGLVEEVIPMIPSTFRQVLTVTVAGVLVLSPGLAAAQGQPASQAPSQQQPAGQTTSQPQQTTTQDPSQWPTQWPQPTPPPPPPQAPTPQATSQPPQKTAADQPVQQKDTVTPKNSKEDVEAIGNRGVGKGVIFIRWNAKSHWARVWRRKWNDLRS